MPSTLKKSFAAEQLRQRKKMSPGLWILLLVVVIAAVIAGYVVYSRYIDVPVPVPGKAEIRSIAVLPLDNMSGDPDQVYFTDGMHEALINNLSKIGALRVISRTSVMEYRETKKKVPEIAQELDVDAVIEGSVFRADNQVRITVQLIAAQPEQHLWSNEYTRELRDVISLQNEVAQAIAGEIQITVTPEEEKRLVSSYTVNPEAYDYYLRGSYYGKRSSGKEDRQIAIQMFQKAIDLDPEFALAYARLSFSHTLMYWFYYDRTTERLSRGKEAADKALELEPDLPMAHLALGIYYYWGHLDYDRALEQFTIARKIQPNNSMALEYIGYVQRRQGKFDEALANIRKASELDPLRKGFAREVGYTFMFIRNYPEAERYYNRAISLAPDYPGNYSSKAWLYILWEGSTEKALAVLEEASKNFDLAESPQIINTLVNLDVYDGNYQGALDRLSSKAEDIDGQGYFIPKVLRYALIYRYMNKNDLAKTYCDSTRIILETRIQERPEDARLHSSLGIAYAGMGRKEDAIREGKLGVALLPVSKEAMGSLSRIVDLARIYVMVGEYDKAIDQLEFLLSRPGYMTVHLLRLDPIWAPLRDHPRFKALVKKMGME